jgi:AraC-like DNA-binding protein
MANNYDLIVAHPDTFKQLKVGDLLFAFYRCPQVEKTIHLCTHFNMISFTLNGERIIHQGGKSWKVNKSATFFTRKTGYIQELPDSAGWEVLAFFIPDEFLRNVVDEFRDYLPTKNLPEVSEDMLIEIKMNDTIKAYFYAIIPYFNQNTPPFEKLLELKFKELLLNILSNPLNKQLLAYLYSLKDNYKTPIWQVMEKNYMHNLSIKELAKISNRSVTSFKKDFYEYYHATPGRWIMGKRLKYAEMLLTTSNLSISDVAFNSGFENSSHFSRIFKEKFGSSPQRYRKSLQ